MIPQRHRDMIALACALSWELDKLLPHPAEDADSWDPLACYLVRRMIRTDEALAARRKLTDPRVLVVALSPGGDA